MAEPSRIVLPALLTIADVARICGISAKTVRRLVERQDLSAIRVGNQLRIDPRDLEDYIRTHRIR